MSAARWIGALAAAAMALASLSWPTGPARLLPAGLALLTALAWLARPTRTLLLALLAATALATVLLPGATNEPRAWILGALGALALGALLAAPPVRRPLPYVLALLGLAALALVATTWVPLLNQLRTPTSPVPGLALGALGALLIVLLTAGEGEEGAGDGER